MNSSTYSTNLLFTVPVSSPGAATVDEKSGLIYVIEDAGGVRIIKPGGAAGPLVPVPSPLSLAIAPAFPGTALGRLYIGVVEGGANKIKVFDINGSVDAPSSSLAADITSLAAPALKLAHNPSSRDILFSLGSSSPDIGKYQYRDLPLFPALIEADTSMDVPPFDIALDKRTGQLFAAGRSSGSNLLLRIRGADNGGLESFVLNLFGASFTPKYLKADSEKGVVILISEEGADDLRLRKYSTRGDTNIELDSLLLSGINGIPSDGRLAIDDIEHLIFVVGNNKLSVVDNRGERMELAASVTLPLLGPYHIALDKSRRRIVISSKTDGVVYVYGYSFIPAAVPSRMDGRLQLVPNAPAVNPDNSKILAWSDLDSDLHMMRPDGPIPSGASGKPSGQIGSIGGPSSGRHLPDGVLLTSVSTDAPVSVTADMLSYNTTELFGTAPPNAEDPGLRRGALEFRVKFPRLDGIDPLDPPQKVVLYDFFEKGTIDPFSFIRKSGAHTDQEELAAILGSPVDTTSPITFSTPAADFLILTRLYLDSLQDTDGDGMVDAANLHLERYSDIAPITVNYTPGGAAPFDPVEFNYFASSVPISISGGEWHHIAFSWRANTAPMPPAGNNKERAQQELFVDGVRQPAGVSSDMPQLDPGAPYFRFGAVISDPSPPNAGIHATIDDIILYRDETALPAASFAPRRFSAAGEPFTDANMNGYYDLGEPFEDYNMNGDRDNSGDPFTDANNNGTWDIGESFSDAGNNRYDRLAEPFADGACANPPGQYEDYNKNGQCDPGELYSDLDKSGGRNAGEGFTDSDKNRIYNGNGYFANTFTVPIPAGSRIGALAWTEYKPAGTAINAELILRANDGRILLRWFSDNEGAKGTPVNLLVPEEARLEYRVNFLIRDIAGTSPVLDDITVTVISEPNIIHSQEISRPFRFDPSLGVVSGSEE